MLKNFLTTALRNVRRNKTYTIINMVGLSFGIGCSLLIFSIINYHLSFDRFHPDAGRIYRIVTEFHQENVGYSQGIQAPVAKAFRDEYTFAEKLARIYNGYGNVILPADPDKRFNEAIAFAEPRYFDIFDLPLIEGDKRTAITDPGTAIISQNIAVKYFGNSNAIGKTIRVGDKHDFTVTGILKNPPANTDRRTEIYLSYASLKDFDSKIGDYWTGVYGEHECFMVLKKGLRPSNVEQLFPAFNQKHFTGNDIKTFVYRLQPLSDIHFNTSYGAVIEKKKLWALGFIGLFLIITACVNFINLATAQAIRRSKEVGVRKVLGSRRSQLFWQFMAETSFIGVASVVFACLLAIIALPYVNSLFGIQISLDPFHNVSLAAFLLVITAVVIFAAGSYPALIMSGFKPVLALKNKRSEKYAGSFSLRRILVVSQFAISQMLIIASVVIASQISYSTSSDLGFDKEATVLLPLPMDDLEKMTSLKHRLQAMPAVKSTSLCFQAPASLADNYTSARFDNRDKDEPFNVNTKDADEGYVPTFGLRIIAGRNIFHSDSTREFVINETLVKKLGLQSPRDAIGKRLMTSRGKRNGIIVGVMKDFYNSSFHGDIAPICIRSDFKNYNYCAVNINLGNTKSTLASMEKTWNSIYPESVFGYQFISDSIKSFYALDNIMLKLVVSFAGIAIFISCLGLFGLVSFMAVQKTKEIGIRKVLGARIQNILWLFGKEFSRLVLIAFGVAAPIGWWAMKNYLQDYKYRIPLGADIFIIAIFSTFIIAAVTVGYQSIKAAVANPVKSLKTE